MIAEFHTSRLLACVAVFAACSLGPTAVALAPQVAAQSVPIGGASDVPPVPADVVLKAMSQGQRAVALDQNKKIPEAIAAYNDFLALAPGAKIAVSTQVRVAQRLAFLYQTRGDIKGVENSLLKVIKLDPSNALAGVQLAGLYVTEKKMDLARQVAQKALSGNPSPKVGAIAHHVLGSVLVAKRDLVGAEREFTLAVTLQPSDPQAHIDLAFVYVEEQKYSQAVSEAVKARNIDPRRIQTHIFLASIELQAGKLPAALEEYDAVLAIQPENALALNGRAMLLHRSGKIQDAISAYLVAVATSPTNYEIRYNLANLYYSIQNYGAAKMHFSEAHRLQPKDPRALSGLALSEQKEASTLFDKHQREDEQKQAEADYKAAMEVTPKASISGTATSLASLYEDEQRFDDAIAIYRDEIAKNPKISLGYRKLAEAFLRQHKVDDVVGVWNQFRTAAPDNPEGYLEVADWLNKTGKYAGAIDSLKALLQINIDNGSRSNVKVMIAQDYEKLNQDDKARAEYNEVLAVNPSSNAVAKGQQVAELAAIQAERLHAYRGLAELDQKANKLDDAIGEWRRYQVEQTKIGAKSGQYDRGSFVAIASLYEAQKKPELAIKEYRALADLIGQDAGAYEQMGRLLEQTGRNDEAVSAYLKAAALSKDPVPDSVKVGDLYDRTKQSDKAIEFYKGLETKFPGNEKLLTSEVLVLKHAGKDGEALAVYDAIIKIDPEARWASDDKAIALIRLKRYPEAEAIYTKSIDKSPNTRQTYTDLANVYNLEGKPDAFLDFVKSRLEKTPASPTLLNVTIDEFIRQKKESAGWTYLQSVAEKHTESPDTLQRFAELLNERNKRTESVAMYKELAEQNPKDLSLQQSYADELDYNGQKDEASKVYLALIAAKDITENQRIALRRKYAQRCVLQGDDATAIQQYQEVSKSVATDFEARSELARLLVKTGRNAEAAPIYVGLASQTAYPGVVRSRLMDQAGEIYEKLGKIADAVSEYNGAIALNPSDIEASAALKRLAPK